MTNVDPAEQRGEVVHALLALAARGDRATGGAVARGAQDPGEVAADERQPVDAVRGRLERALDRAAGLLDALADLRELGRRRRGPGRRGRRRRRAGRGRGRRRRSSRAGVAARLGRGAWRPRTRRSRSLSDRPPRTTGVRLEGCFRSRWCTAGTDVAPPAPLPRAAAGPAPCGRRRLRAGVARLRAGRRSELLRGRERGLARRRRCGPARRPRRARRRRSRPSRRARGRLPEALARRRRGDRRAVRWSGAARRRDRRPGPAGRRLGRARALLPRGGRARSPRRCGWRPRPPRSCARGSPSAPRIALIPVMADRRPVTPAVRRRLIDALSAQGRAPPSA